MKQYQLYEDRLPSKLLVRFSYDISKKINTIDSYNQNNIGAVSQWYDYLDGIKSYLSNPVIAWDYTNRFSQFPNGARFIRDFDYNVGYTIKTNNTTNQPYVYVFMVNLKPEEFGLEVPSNVSENVQRHISRIVSESINNLVREIIEEDRQRRIQRIVRETIERYINNLVA